MLITNNTKKAPDAIFNELAALGFAITRDAVLSCLSATVAFLRERKCEECYVIGNHELKGFFAEQGFEVTNLKEPSCDGAHAVVVGDDRAITKGTMSLAIRALLNGAVLIGLHNKRICRDESGQIEMDVGGIVAALEYCADTGAIIMGKPSEDFYTIGMNMLGAEPDEIVIISDDPIADLVTPKRMGMTTYFVKTGTYKDDKILEEIRGEDAPDGAYMKISDIPF